MTGQLELWTDPCDTAEPVDRDLTEWLHGRSRPIGFDHGRPAGRPDAWRLFKPVVDVPMIRGDLL